MNFILLETNGWWVIATLAVIALAIVSVLLLLTRRRRNSESIDTIEKPPRVRSADRSIVQHEIDRMLAGTRPDDVAIKQLSRESRVLFEVSVIDLLMNASHEEQQLVRAALVKCGYDEHCARRVMGEEISDRIRASTLLNLLRQPKEIGADGAAKPIQPRSVARAAGTAIDMNSGATLEPARSDHSASNPVASDN